MTGDMPTSLQDPLISLCACVLAVLFGCCHAPVNSEDDCGSLLVLLGFVPADGEPVAIQCCDPSWYFLDVSSEIPYVPLASCMLIRFLRSVAWDSLCPSEFHVVLQCLTQESVGFAIIPLQAGVRKVCLQSKSR